MKIGILGTGMVGEALGTTFVQLGHQVKMGSRSANNESAGKWVKASGNNASQGTFADAAQFGEIVFVCLKGEVVLDVVRSVAGFEQIGHGARDYGRFARLGTRRQARNTRSQARRSKDMVTTGALSK